MDSWLYSMPCVADYSIRAIAVLYNSALHRVATTCCKIIKWVWQTFVFVFLSIKLRVKTQGWKWMLCCHAHYRALVISYLRLSGVAQVLEIMLWHLDMLLRKVLIGKLTHVHQYGMKMERNNETRRPPTCRSPKKAHLTWFVVVL